VERASDQLLARAAERLRGTRIHRDEPAVDVLDEDVVGCSLFATIRRYDGVDQNRTVELISKVNETLVPKLSKLQGFKGYYMIEAGNGIISSVAIFETSEQADESTKLAASWVRDEKLETAFPNPPKITSGKIVAQSNGVAVA
jgi:hypothetical protein